MTNRFFNPLPGVPSIESPFFDQIFAALDPDPETQRVAVDLRTKGYAVLDFPDPDIFIMADRIKEKLYAQYDWQSWHDGVASFSTRVCDGWTIDPDVKRIATNPEMRDLLGRLYGRIAFPFQTLNFCVGSQQHVHSDCVHFSSNPERFMCGVWVALEDTDEENGPLIYYPGSHAWPIFTNEHIGVNSTTLDSTYEAYPRYEEMWQNLIEAHHSEPERFHAKKGQALIWTANLLHGGDTHHDKSRTRWSQVTHYYFEGCSYYTPLLSEPFAGSIHMREPMDINSGGIMRNFVTGVQTSDNFIKASAIRPEPTQPRALPVAPSPHSIGESADQSPPLRGFFRRFST